MFLLVPASPDLENEANENTACSVSILDFAQMHLTLCTQIRPKEAGRELKERSLSPPNPFIAGEAGGCPIPKALGHPPLQL